MILIDTSNIAVAGFIMMSNDGSEAVTLGSFRHRILNSIRKIIKSYGSKYGADGIFLCIDSPSWRYHIFPQYKIRRKLRKAADEYDWKWYQASLNTIVEELKSNLGVNIISSRGAETDDIIGVVCRIYSSTTKILIVSRDTDFCSTHNENIKQYDPISDKYVECDDPKRYLFEKIVRGDSTDDIPNILSPVEVFITEGARQKSVYQKSLDVWYNQPIESFCTPEMLERFKLNRALIDLTFTPKPIQSEIELAFETERQRVLPTLNDLRKYSINNHLHNILEQLHDFQY